MEIITTYPPEVQALRDSLLALIENEKAATQRKLDALPPFSYPQDRDRAVQRIQVEYLEAIKPITEELANCERFAAFGYISEPPVGVLPSPSHST